MKTAEVFIKKAREMGITRWNIHESSMCSYKCGYILREDKVLYDAGCECVQGSLKPGTWEDVAQVYNMNADAPDAEERIKKHPAFKEIVKDMKKFWGFPEGQK